MTILGKMMAIFVLILSFAQGALTVMLFVSSSQWVAANKTLKNQVATAVASAGQFQDEVERVRTEGKNEKAALDARVAKLDQDLKAQIALTEGAERQLSDEKQKVLVAESTSRQAINDAKLRQADNDRMIGVVKERDNQIALLVISNKKEREDRLNAEIAMKTAVQRAQAMEERLRDAVMEIAKQKNQASGTTTTSAKTTGPNPPAENVEGLVSDADKSGLVEITIGSDAGLKEGNTMEAYRIAAVPSQSQYLGMIRIKKVFPNKAVAEPVGRMAAPLQRGDHVASRLGS
jgi:phage host-nuclease inhibitor protein Gam